ncbi:hypothetical protein [Oligoflexus tunisiensis]|uniref:hypothetical protein n=1 Tax=Oligoflexus tunisiensis TaxID=708132 RepID=UPI00114C8AB2|nr:hypothetical protein [Oligoflexus tunisiensis]
MKNALIMLTLLLANLGLAADILVIRPDADEFRKLSEMIEKNLNNEYSLVNSTIAKSTSYEEFEEKIAKSGARVVVAMDNQAIRHLKKYFELKPESKIRGIAAMGVNLKDLIPKNKYIAGVAYEVAGYLAIKGFKSATQSKARSALGVYRSSVSRIFAEEARTQLAREKIDLKLLDLEGKSEEDISDAIKYEVKKNTPEAIWLINDNKIINSRTISTLWLEAARQQKIPLICGIQRLSKELGICVYSETPTLHGTAEKITGIIYGYIADENDADFYGVEYIQETEKTTNKYLMDAIGINPLKQVDGVEIYSGEINGL